MTVTPSTWHRRIAAQAIDLSMLGTVLYFIARLLPDGPPPADSMSFFTKQDFINYFILVLFAVILTTVTFQLVKAWHATPGQYLLRMTLTTLDGDVPSPDQVNTRLRTALVNLLLIMLPGPIIALVVGVTAAALLNIPFTTADKALLKLEISQAIRYSIHGVSFAALAAAIWAIAVRPALAYFERANAGLTALDIESGTTHVRRSDAF